MRVAEKKIACIFQKGDLDDAPEFTIPLGWGDSE